LFRRYFLAFLTVRLAFRLGRGGRVILPVALYSAMALLIISRSSGVRGMGSTTKSTPFGSLMYSVFMTAVFRFCVIIAIPALLIVKRLHARMADPEHTYDILGETISHPVMMLFQRPVTAIVVSLIFIGGVYLRIGDRFLHRLSDFKYHNRSILGRIFADVLKYLSHLFL
jgi:hypothetical protein